MDDVSPYQKELTINWDTISSSHNTTMARVLLNPNGNWNWSLLSKNPNILMKDVVNNLDNPWSWSMLSLNPNIRMKDVVKYPGGD